MNQKQKQAVTLVFAGVALVAIAGMGYEYRADQVEASARGSMMNDSVSPGPAAGGGKRWSSKPWSGDWDDGYGDGPVADLSLSYSFAEASAAGSKSAKLGKGARGAMPESGRDSETESRSSGDVLLSYSEPECGYDDRFHLSRGGQCRDDAGKAYDRVWTYSSGLDGGEDEGLESCRGFCDSFAAEGYRGLSYYRFDRCYCHYDAGTDPGCPEGGPETCRVSKSFDGGFGSVGGVSGTGTVYSCYPYNSCEDL